MSDENQKFIDILERIKHQCGGRFQGTLIDEIFSDELLERFLIEKKKEEASNAIPT